MKKSILLACVSALLLIGCKDATRATWRSMSQPHKVTIYDQNGGIIKTWYSTGSVSEQGGSYWYFEDAYTKTLVEIASSQAIVVEQVTPQQLADGLAEMAAKAKKP